VNCDNCGTFNFEGFYMSNSIQINGFNGFREDKHLNLFRMNLSEILKFLPITICNISIIFVSQIIATLFNFTREFKKVTIQLFDCSKKLGRHLNNKYHKNGGAIASSKYGKKSVRDFFR
jgi:hypothetical protein